MWVYFNGRICPEAEARVSLFDRGFLYGDGLFETILFRNRRLFRWPQHWARLSEGLLRLQLACPVKEEEWVQAFQDLAEREGRRDGLARLAISRGPGPRGYAPRKAGPPTMALSLHPWGGEEAERLGSCRLHTVAWRSHSSDPTLRLKSASKLSQVLANLEAIEAGAEEALVCNEDGHVTETASGNILVKNGGRLVTPPLSDGLLPGVTRLVLLELARDLGWAVEERSVTREELASSEGVWVSQTRVGLAEATELDGKPLPRSAAAIRLHRAYWQAVERECAPE